MARRGPLHDVELVEDDEPDDVLDDGLDPAAPGESAARPRRTPLVVGAAVLAVALVVAVVGQTVVDRRERVRLAAVADLRGVVAPLAGPPTVLWDMDIDSAFAGGVRAADVLVGVEHATQGPVEVAATDTRTGAEAWRVELLDGSGRPGNASTDEYLMWSGSCAVDPGHQDVVACLVHDGGWVTGDAELSDATLAASHVRVVVLDARDGSVLADLSPVLDLEDPVGSLAVVGDVVAVVTPAGDGAEVRAVRTDGTPVWRTTVPADGEEQQLFLTTLADLVAVISDTDLTLLDAAGRVERTVPLDAAYVTGTPGVELFVVPSGQAAEEQDERARDGAPVQQPRTTTTVLRPGTAVEVTGDPVWGTVDDGSVPGLVLTTDGSGLTAWDDEGRELWTADVRAASGTIVLDGRVHVEDGLDVLTLDARTGAELWRSDVASGMPVTDGQHLLALAAAPGRGRRAEIIALDPANGAERWRGPLPDGTTRLEARDHLLLAVVAGPTSQRGLDERYRVLG